MGKLSSTVIWRILHGGWSASGNVFCTSCLHSLGDVDRSIDLTHRGWSAHGIRWHTGTTSRLSILADVHETCLTSWLVHPWECDCLLGRSPATSAQCCHGHPSLPILCTACTRAHWDRLLFWLSAAMVTWAFPPLHRMHKGWRQPTTAVAVMVTSIRYPVQCMHKGWCCLGDLSVISCVPRWCQPTTAGAAMVTSVRYPLQYTHKGWCCHGDLKSCILRMYKGWCQPLTAGAGLDNGCESDARAA